MNTIHLNDNWIFYYGDCPQAWQKRYKPKDWQEVDIPHDWSVTMPFSKDNSSGTGYLAGGIGWYRKSFYIPENNKGKVIELLFDGVYKNSQVWINGYYLGKRPNGYINFSYDVSDRLCFGDEPNLISVKVEHDDIADSRWFTGSGITRKVSLRIFDKVHAQADSILFKTLKSNEKSAEVEVQSKIVNQSCKQVDVSAGFTLLDGEGKSVLTLSEDVVIDPKSCALVKLQGQVENPRIWDVESPDLYTLKIVTGSDAQEVKVGIRSFEFDGEKGFFLNGKSTKIKGVCVHHDAGCLGAAVYKSVWRRRLEKFKEVGCNAIRMSHNPAMPELYDLCDEMGFLVMDEAFDEWEGVKNKWRFGHNVYPPAYQGYYKDFPQWHKKDLEAMVLRDRNHPSVIMWSVGNEIDYPNDPYCHPLFSSMTGNNDKNKPEEERMFDVNRPNTERLIPIAKELKEIVKNLDDTRPVVLAFAFPELSAKIGLVDIFDVVCYNYKEHLYDEAHKQYSDKAILGSENGLGIKEWNAVKDNQYVVGQFLWTGIDFLGEAHGWPIRGSQAGIMDLAGYEKPIYYIRKSLWAKQPSVNILTNISSEELPYGIYGLSRKWNYLSKELIDVSCFANCQSVELILNGKSMGKKDVDAAEGCASWNIEFEEGVIEAIAYSDGNKMASDRIESYKTACDIKLIECKNADNDIVQVEGFVVDNNGLIVGDNTSRFYFSIEGDASILGIENGDQSDLTEYSAKYKRAYHGRFIVYIKKATDKAVKLVVKSEGMKTRFIEI